MFQKLSTDSGTLNEKRLVFQRKGPQPAPKKDDVLGDVFGESIIKTPSQATLKAAEKTERSRIADSQKQEFRQKLLEKMGRKGYEFPGRKQAWNELCKQLANEGVRVTQKDLSSYEIDEEKTGEVDPKELEKVVKFNKAEQLKVAISNFFTKEQELLDFVSRALAEIHLIQKSYKNGEKDPVCQKECEIVRDTVRSMILEDRTLAKLLPELAPKYEKMREIKLARQPKPIQ